MRENEDFRSSGFAGTLAKNPLESPPPKKAWRFSSLGKSSQWIFQQAMFEDTVGYPSR